MKTGIMIVGLGGVLASVLISGCIAMKLGVIPKQYGITASEDFLNLNLLDIDDLVFSGWDYFFKNQYELYKQYGIVKVAEQEPFISELKAILPYKGIHTEKDIQVESRFDYIAEIKHASEAISVIEENIQDFKNRYQVSNVIVLYLGSPGKKVSPELKQLTYEDILKLPTDALPSGLYYTVAAANCYAHFIDFTPSETLEFDFLHDLAKKKKVQLSGRDGSTGQTMLKLTLANMLKIRNLKLRGWYSTNILGNHDGYILSNPDYCKTKMEDKKSGLAPLLGYDDFEHKVTIDFFKTRFDSKESWDSIDFTGWMGTPMSLKVNWKGEDSILSAPIILDLIRLIEFGIHYDLGGFQKQLGLFYKHPFYCEGQSLETMYRNLILFYQKLITK